MVLKDVAVALICLFMLLPKGELFIPSKRRLICTVARSSKHLPANVCKLFTSQRRQIQICGSRFLLKHSSKFCNIIECFRHEFRFSVIGHGVLFKSTLVDGCVETPCVDRHAKYIAVAKEIVTCTIHSLSTQRR